MVFGPSGSDHATQTNYISDSGDTKILNKYKKSINRCSDTLFGNLKSSEIYCLKIPEQTGADIS